MKIGSIRVLMLTKQLSWGFQRESPARVERKTLRSSMWSPRVGFGKGALGGGWEKRRKGLFP